RRLATGLDDEIAARLDRPRERGLGGRLPCCPAEKMAVWKVRARRVHTAEPGFGILEVTPSRFPRFVDENARVMDGLGRPGPELDRPHEPPRRDRHWQNEIAE